MSENETWLEHFLNENPTDNFKFDSYYIEERENIKNKINQLLTFKILDEQLNRAIDAWNFRIVLIERCKRYDFGLLRNEIDELIEQTEANLVRQKYITKAVNSLSPIIGHGNVHDVISVDESQLLVLKRIRGKLFRTRGNKGDESYLIKRAYFELFFIAELLKLTPPIQNYTRNDLITFAEIITKPSNYTRATISAHYQDYEKVKRCTPVISSLIQEGKQAYLDIKEWCRFLELFQDNIYCHLSIPS